MRVVDIHTTGERPLDVVLHPRLTVLTGDRAACSALAEALARAFVLAGTDVSGTVEYAGYHARLDQSGVVMLDLPGEGFRVVTGAELPEPDTATRRAAIAELADRRQGWRDWVATTAAELERRRRRHGAVVAARDVGADELIAAREAESVARTELEAALRRPETLDAELATARQEVEQCQEHLRTGLALAPEVREGFDRDSGDAGRVRSGDDTTELVELLERAVSAGLIDPGVGEELREWLHEVAAGTSVPDAGILDVLDEVDALEQEWERLSSIGVEDEPEVVDARGRHDALLARRDALEELAASGILADRARSEIDAAHANRVELEGERHLRSGALDAAVKEEAVVTARYGFDSYLDYTIALSTRSVGDAVQGTLERVRAETVGASDALETARAEAAAARHAVAERRAALRERIRAEAGVDAEVLSADVLRRIPQIPPALSQVPEMVELACAALQVAAEDASQRVEALEVERVSIQEAGGAQRGVLEAASARVETLDGLVEAAARELAIAEQELVAAQTAAEEAEGQLAELDSQLAALETSDPTGYDAADVAVVVAGLTPSLDPPGPDPTPALMIDTFEPLGTRAVDALEATLAAAVRVQLVYLTEDPLVVEWAQELEPTAGSLVRLGKPGWFQRRMARRRARPERELRPM